MKIRNRQTAGIGAVHPDDSRAEAIDGRTGGVPDLHAHPGASRQGRQYAPARTTMGSRLRRLPHGAQLSPRKRDLVREYFLSGLRNRASPPGGEQPVPLRTRQGYVQSANRFPNMGRVVGSHQRDHARRMRHQPGQGYVPGGCVLFLSNRGQPGHLFRRPAKRSAA